MIRRIAAAIAVSFIAVAACVATAGAAGNINGPYDTTIMTTTGPISVLAFGAQPGYYVGLSSVGGPQTATISLYDSAGVCSGTLIFNGIPGNSQEIQKIWPGRQVRLGITACASGAIVGSVEIYSR